jgi:IS30 family transposase
MARAENVEYVTKRLQEYWSPDQIAGRSRRDFPEDSHRQLSRQVIYNWLDIYDHRQPLQKCLRRYSSGRGRQTKPSGPPANAVANRPAEVSERSRYGDWEADTIVGPGAAVLLSQVERRSGYLSLLSLAARRSVPVRQAICGRLTQFPPALRLTLTLDNGSEFAEAPMLESAVGLQVYRTRPHSPWERGSIENLNGLIRQYFPKGTRFDEQSRYRVAQVEQSLNDRPRQRLEYQTPSEVFLPLCQRAIET